MTIRRPLLLFASALTMWLAIWSVAVAQTMRAHFIDVGQGAATLVEFPCAAILVDTGGEENSEFSGTETLIEFLEQFFAGRPDLNKTLHSLVLTHPHKDHTHAVRAVLGRYRILNAVTNGQERGSGRVGQIALHKRVADAEETPDPNDDIAFEPVWLRDIPPNQGLTNPVIDPVSCPTVDPRITALWGQLDRNPGWKSKEFLNANNHSVVLRIDFGKSSLLISGDLEETAIPMLIEHYKNSRLLDVDVFHVGHHGSHNGVTDGMLRAITPEIAVIAMGASDREESWTAWAYGHPRKTVVDLLQRHVSGSRPPKEVEVATAAKRFTTVMMSRAIYGTGWDGTVVLEADVNGMWRFIDSSEPMPLVNINTAGMEELMTLPMIGESRAKTIIRHRADMGNFESVEDLRKVPGIGRGTVQALRHLVTTGR